MLVELLNGIVDLARKSQSVQTHELPGNQLLVVMPDGTYQTQVRDEMLVTDILGSFASLCDWGAAYGADFLSVSHAKIHASADRHRPHLTQQARMNLESSAAYADLLLWVREPRTIRQVVRGLRTTLAGTCTDEYQSIFKRIDFKRKNDGSRSVTHTGESMGRSVEAAAQSAAGEIPEVLRFDVQLYSNVPVESYNLSFAVEVDADTEKVSIMPVGDCIEQAIHQTVQDLVARLKTEFPEALVVEAA